MQENIGRWNSSPNIYQNQLTSCQLVCLVDFYITSISYCSVVLTGPTGEQSEIPNGTDVHTASDQRLWGRWLLGDGHVLRGWWRRHWRLHSGESAAGIRRRYRQGGLMPSVENLSSESCLMVPWKGFNAAWTYFFLLSRNKLKYIFSRFYTIDKPKQNITFKVFCNL